MRTTTWCALSFVTLPFAGIVACAPPVPAVPSSIPVDAGIALATADASARDASHVGPSAPLRETTAPPVSPSLISLGDGERAAIADPDTDRLYVVALDERRVAATIDLPRGVEPGRLVEDARGRVHVVLRRGGGIATLEPGAASVTRRETCAAPRGIAFRASDDTLVVACAEGLVVFLPASGGPATRVLHVDDDLRDVVVLGERIFVSRFRSAEVLAIDGDGAVVARFWPATVERPDALTTTTDPADQPTATFTPEVAWRMVRAGSGIWLLHQRARTSAIRATAHGVSYAPAVLDPANDCAFGMVESAVSFIAEDQPPGPLAPTLPLTTALAADVAYRPAPPHLEAGDWRAAPGLAVDARCASFPAESLALVGGAVAYSPAHGMLKVSGHPLELAWSVDGARVGVELAEEPDWSDADVGRAIFQTVQPSRIACASCHPEGGDDGHVWSHGTPTAVRTQSMQGRILDTAPFHWEGDVPDFSALVDEVLVSRMHGSPLHPVRAAAFAAWVDTLDPPPRPLSDSAAIARGRALFESAELGCTGCHRGPRYSSSDTVDVGTGGLFQVPVLVGVAYRAPYMHTGCATTLRERFTASAACTGGDRHGHTSDLAQTEIDDLVAYLRSL